MKKVTALVLAALVICSACAALADGCFTYDGYKVSVMEEDDILTMLVFEGGNPVMMIVLYDEDGQLMMDIPWYDEAWFDEYGVDTLADELADLFIGWLDEGFIETPLFF